MERFFPDFDKAKALSFLKTLHFDAKQKISSLSKGQREQVQFVLFFYDLKKYRFLGILQHIVDGAAVHYTVMMISTSKIPCSSPYSGLRFYTDNASQYDQRMTDRRA